MKVISTVSGKGGVGKTASSLNIATGLAMEGYKVLIMDLDKQYNATDYLGAYDPKKKSVYDIFINKTSPIEVIQNTKIENLDIIPSTYDLEDVPDRILLDINRSRESRLKEILTLEYDYVIIDCPPALDIITVNALVISDYVLVPIKIDKGGLEGFDKIVKKMAIVREEYNSKLKLLGCFVTMDNKTNVNKQMKEHLKGKLKDKFFKTTIRNGVTYVESTFDCTPVILAEPKSKVAVDYMKLVKEVLANVKEV